MKKWGYWTFENCKMEASKYNKINDWVKNSPSSYNIALKNDWLVECCSHIKHKKKPNGYWDKINCISEALNYNTRSEWAIKSSSSYTIAHKNKWLVECCSHMEVLGSRYKRLVYAFEFSDNSVYIGLTYNLNERKNEHLNPKRIKKTSVYQHIEKTGLIPEFKILSEYLDKNVASLKEGELLQKYVIEGWIILNKVRTGGLGGKTLIWTKEKCVEEALKFKSKIEWFNKSCSSYVTACKNKWLDECCQHMISCRKLTLSKKSIN